MDLVVLEVEVEQSLVVVGVVFHARQVDRIIIAHKTSMKEIADYLYFRML